MFINYVIIFVSNMQQSIVFYRDILGLPMRFESSHWTEFTSEGATLALHLSNLHAVKNDAAQSEIPGMCHPGLKVPNLDEFHKKMIENNVPCLQVPKETFGARIAKYADPDGLVISVSD